MLKYIKLFLSFISIVYSQNCILEVPNNPLTNGLFDLWFVSSDNPNILNCTQLLPEKAVFVEATILDKDTGNFFVYYPLVVDKGTQPAVLPQVLNLPVNNNVVIHFGTNNIVLKLVSSLNNIDILGINNCVNGINNSIFGQFAYCNAVNFFNDVNNMINISKIIVPFITNSNKGLLCPTVRYFGLVDQDQSDNVLSNYIITNDNKVAQNTILNRKNLNITKIVSNGSDNRLLNVFINPAIGCNSFTVPDLLEPNILRSSLALNEIQAHTYGNINKDALVPAQDPMTLVNGQQSIDKVNSYRNGVNQPLLQSLNVNNDINYCTNMENTSTFFLTTYLNEFINFNSPDNVNNLLVFLCDRFSTSWVVLNCNNLLNKTSPIFIVINYNGLKNCNLENTQPTNTPQPTNTANTNTTNTNTTNTNTTNTTNTNTTNTPEMLNNSSKNIDLNVYIFILFFISFLFM